jgi:multidrug efflux system outer membrane protein
MPVNFSNLSTIKRSWATLLSMLFCSCITDEPLQQAAALDLPGNWQFNQSDHETPIKQSTFRFPISDFKSTVIPELVDEALKNNPFLQSAEALAEVASSQIRATRSQGRPQLKGRFQNSRQKYNLGTNPAFSRFSSGSTFISNHFAADIILNWEIDLWGRLKDLEKASGADYEAALSDLESARLSIAAQTAHAWCALTTANLRIKLAAQTVASYEANLKIIQDRFRQGLATALDLRLTQASLTSAQAILENESRQEANGRRALEILLARYPSGKAAPGKSLPKLESDIPAGIPIQLLDRRPDIRAAHQRLRAAGFREKEAGKGFLPRIGLTGSTGTASQNLRDLTESSFSSWNLLGNLTQPIFNQGQIRSHMKINKAMRTKAVADYKASLLNALREVEDALDAESSLAREEIALRQAAIEFAEAETLAWDRYRQGLVDIIIALEAQRRTNEARSRELSIQAKRIYNRIQLHLALGTPIATSII